jgi:peroxiredoxin
MPALESTDIPLGSPMPPFNLRDPNGVVHVGDQAFGANGLLVVFTCNHCPYAIAVWPRLIRLDADARSAGVHIVAINPNIHPGYPDDAPAEMKNKIREWGIPFPYLVDETQDVARSFGAQCTPDIFLYDRARRLVYHGEIDDSWKDESQVRRHELREAVIALGEGKSIDPHQVPTIGCSIKWKA